MMTEYREKLLAALTETIREMRAAGVTPVTIADELLEVQPVPREAFEALDTMFKWKHIE